jgi:hypothetical protein
MKEFGASLEYNLFYNFDDCTFEKVYRRKKIKLASTQEDLVE